MDKREEILLNTMRCTITEDAEDVNENYYFKWDDVLKAMGKYKDQSISDIEEKYTLIDAELTKAKQKHPDYPDDMFRQVAIINEESGEATKAVLHYHYENGSIEDIKKELIQAAAMCMRMYEKLTDKFREDINIDYSREDGK